MIYINGFIKESIVDGDGLRFVLFVQGCPHHCKGCHNPQTWNDTNGKWVLESDIITQIPQEKNEIDIDKSMENYDSSKRYKYSFISSRIQTKNI